MLLWFAGMFLLSAVLAFFLGRRGAARAARAERTPTSRIATFANAHVELTGVVEIQGVVKAAPDGTFPTPIAGVEAVLCRVAHDELDTDADWRTKSVAMRGVPFLVDDASGATALIVPDGAIAPQRFLHRAIARGVPNDADDFFGDHRLPSFEPMENRFLRDANDRPLTLPDGPGAGKDRCVEDALCPGDSIYALGMVRRSTAAAPGYRSAFTPPVIELFAGEGPEQELLLSSEDERAVRAGMRLNTYFAGLFACVAAVLAVWHLLRG